MRDADRAKKIAVRFTVNGKAAAVETYPMARLLDVLRVRSETYRHERGMR